MHRPDFGHIEMEKTLADPKALAKPLVVPLKLELDADTEMIEYVCAENERDRQHMVGSAADELKNAVTVAPQILAKYAGIYDFKPPERPGITLVLSVALEGDRISINIDGGPKRSPTPLSETKFFFREIGGNLEFVKNDQGEVTEVTWSIVEGNYKAPRRH